MVEKLMINLGSDNKKQRHIAKGLFSQSLLAFPVVTVDVRVGP